MISASILAAFALTTEACHPVAGDRVTAGDLVAAIPAWTELPPGTFVGFSPEPGRRRVFSPEELQRAGQTAGTTIAVPRPVCVEWSTRPLESAPIEAALRRAIPAADARLELLDYLHQSVPEGKLVFLPAGLTGGVAPDRERGVIWKGFVEYGNNRKLPIWAKVRIFVSHDAVVAAEPLRAGAPIRPGQIRSERLSGLPVFSPVVTSVEQTTGAIPRHWIPAGTAILAAMLETPLEVTRGQIVDVEARSGAVRFQLKGKAESNGRHGDTILVRNQDSGKPFWAMVEAPGLVVVNEGNRK